MPRFIPVVLPLVLFFVVLILPGCSSTQSDTRSLKALKFDPSSNSHIAFNPDMSSMTEKFSVCLWIRKLYVNRGGPTPFAYGGYSFELFMTDDGYKNRLFNSRSLDGALESKFTVPVGTWYFYCSTWSFYSRTFRIYLNGILVGSERTTSNRRLKTGQTMVLGDYVAGSVCSFRGEIFNLNFFSKELSATEVARLSPLGLCTDIPEQLQDYRAIKWEEILELSRTGNVSDIDTHCALVTELQSGLRETKTELTTVQDQLNSTQEQLVGVKRELETAKEQLNETRLELEESQLEFKNVSESRCALTKGNLTKWDVFYSQPFYNKTFTRRLYQQLRTTWDAINSRLFGVTMTDTIIELVKSMDEQQNCDELS